MKGKNGEGSTKEPVLSSDSLRAFEELLSRFTYDGGSKATSSAPTKPTTRNIEVNSAVGSCRKRRNNKSSSSSSSCSAPSSFIRATVGGETRVFTRFFPLPPGASSPEIIPLEEVERAHRKKRKALAREDAALRSLQRRRQERTVKKEKSYDNGDASLDGIKKKKMKKKRTSPQLSAKEKLSEAYRRVDPETNPWEAPRSPYNLLQERHAFDPWRVMVICLLLNVTTGRQVREKLAGLFVLLRDAETTAKEVPVEEIQESIKKLGLHKKRAAMIKRFSEEYIGTEWTHVTQLFGIGKYAADAYAIFCAGKPELVNPQDHVLVKYWRFVCGKEDARSEKYAEGSTESGNLCCTGSTALPSL